MFGNGKMVGQAAQSLGQMIRQRQGGAGATAPVNSGTHGGWLGVARRAAQIKQGAPTAPTGGAPQGNFAQIKAYADGGKVFKRKPNGKGC